MISRLNSSSCWRELNLNGRDFRLEGSRRHLSDKLLINISVTERQSTTRTLSRMCSALEVDLTDLGIVTGKLREKSERLWMKVVMICKSESLIAWLKLFFINPSIDNSRKFLLNSLNFHFPVGAPNCPCSTSSLGCTEFIFPALTAKPQNHVNNNCNVPNNRIESVMWVNRRDPK